MLILGDEEDSLESLLRIAWIITDHWMSYCAVEDKEIDGATMQEGFQLTLQLFMPWLTEEARRDIPESFRVFSVDALAD